MASTSDIKPWLRPAPRSYILTHANVVDVVTGTILKNHYVLVFEGKIQEVDDVRPSPYPTDYELVDCTGLYICPGLFDAHVHFVAVPGFSDLSMAFGNFNDVSLLRQPYVATQMLHRGFTSVRDCGGAQLALKQAIEDGVFPGPRLFIAGHALSQAGGHGDIRAAHDHVQCCGGHTNGLGRICNGVPECMTAVREEIRSGADFIKIMGSGGVSTPTDRLDQLQFTKAEIQAMVECAENAGTYVTAHAYTPKAIMHCINNGVKGIEHGNFITEEVATIMAERGIYLTPTLISYAEMDSERWRGYLPADGQAKNSEVLTAGLKSLKIASDAGVTLCYGSDLLGPLGIAQTGEFALRAQVLSPLAVLQSATINPAKMMGQEERIGQIKEGFLADILFLNKNPLEDVTVFDRPEECVLGVMKEGRVYKSRWKGLKEDAHIPVRLTPSRQ
ncbi:hypothetical protein ASPBRDRAFT_56849 [Aspergillus brasiliensis CBS 101740]|uniref:Amidohydrolase-related domain-containing protein n=1 Tax=Aspergillus brasiliensis (strain CBS 101740 / IMI 381727 / IBT 21946) TaxID=767769 RepID=A0A1L9UEP0_ASPBC|nr:hypothetical protein ASPBRDRAFT_56849 [Aspergillus brasiliensis CBS 101740]